MHTLRTMIITLFSGLLLAGCGPGEHPAEDYLDRDGPSKPSDTLAAVGVRMIERIQQLPLTGDRDVNIARELIEHHRATLEMNEILLKKREQAPAVNEDLLAFAARLTAMHEKEIQILKEFVDSHPEVPPSGRRGAPDMMKGLSEIQPTDDLGAAYLEIMQIHLRDGFALAEEGRERGQHEKFRGHAASMAEGAEEALAELARMR